MFIVFCQFVLAQFILAGAQGGHQNVFGYCPAEQATWEQEYPDCGGYRQSPIHIKSAKAVRANLGKLHFNGYDRILPQLRLKNDGNSAALRIDGNNHFGNVPTIHGSILKGTYEFVELHFHWGRSNFMGSEHMIDDVMSSLEMHIVHKNVRYTPEEASYERNAYAVLAVLFRTNRRHSNELYPIIRCMYQIQEFNTSVVIHPTFSLNDLLGNINRNNWYHYEGSLTAPPCTESVLWYVFHDYLSCSPWELDELRQLERPDRRGKTVKIYENNRQMQKRYFRKIYSSSKHNSWKFY